MKKIFQKSTSFTFTILMVPILIGLIVPENSLIAFSLSYVIIVYSWYDYLGTNWINKKYNKVFRYLIVASLYPLIFISIPSKSIEYINSHLNHESTLIYGLCISIVNFILIIGGIICYLAMLNMLSMHYKKTLNKPTGIFWLLLFYPFGIWKIELPEMPSTKDAFKDS